MSEFPESIKKRAWTPEQRARQAKRIQEQRPWEKATGPRTAQGKAISSRNAWKGAMRQQLRSTARFLRGNGEALRKLLGGA